MDDLFKLRAMRLELEATKILRSKSGVGPLVIDFLNDRDRNRRERRRAGLLEQHSSSAEPYCSQKLSSTPEDEILSKERADQAKQALRAVLQHFEKNVAVKLILVAVIKKGLSFRDTRQLMKVCGLREKEVKAAKNRIAYYIKTEIQSDLEGYLASFDGGTVK